MMAESNTAAEALVPRFKFERLLNQGTYSTSKKGKSKL
jgi:hypothetical protein